MKEVKKCSCQRQVSSMTVLNLGHGVAFLWRNYYTVFTFFPRFYLSLVSVLVWLNRPETKKLIGVKQTVM